MSDQAPDEFRERRNLRRLKEEQRRQQLVRRRRIAAIGLVGLIVIAGVVVGVALRGSGDANPKTSATTEKRAGDDAKPGAGKSGSDLAAKNPDLITTSSGLVLDQKAHLVSHFKADVPILFYHDLDPPPAGAPYPDLFVPPAEFEAEMTALDKDGFNGVTLRQVFDAWFNGRPLPENPIVISFDDGLRSQYTEARPVLRALRWPGVLNLKVDSVTQGELDAEAVKEMIETGWEVDSHTIDHLDVSTLGGEDLRHQIADSRTELQKMFKIPVDFFCYPAGAYDDESVAAVKQAGYEGATTVDPGLASKDEPFTLKRIRVDGGEGADGLRQALIDAGVKIPNSPNS